MISTTLSELKARTESKFSELPTVVLKDDTFDVTKLPIDKSEWHRLSDVVAVVADLKSSTKLDERRYAASTASIYDAGVGGAVKIFSELDADFVAIQGDGGFALFWGNLRYERAMCAAISIRTFSVDFKKQLESKWPKAPSTGFKVAVASGGVLAKRVGLPKRLEFQEPVWAGKPVNYAAKAAQQTEPENLLITGSVWDEIKNNDFLAISCGCKNGIPGEPTALWEDFEIDKIADDEKYGQKLASIWCPSHGDEYCEAIRTGESKRNDLTVEIRKGLEKIGSSDDANPRNQAAKAREVSRREIYEEVKSMRVQRARV